MKLIVVTTFRKLNESISFGLLSLVGHLGLLNFFLWVGYHIGCQSCFSSGGQGSKLGASYGRLCSYHHVHNMRVGTFDPSILSIFHTATKSISFTT